MTNKVLGVLGDALKIAVAAWATLWIEPRTEEAFPALPEPVHYLIAAVVAAVLLELLLQILFGWPHIKVEWSDKLESAPISEVRAKIRRSTSESQPFHLEVSVPSRGWIGHQLLRLYSRAEVTLHIQIEQARIVPTCENSSRVGSSPNRQPAVTSDDALNGFAVRLGRTPHRPGLWHYADVRWRDESTPRGPAFRIVYLIHHESPFVKFLLNILIWRSTNAQLFRVVGK